MRRSEKYRLFEKIIEFGVSLDFVLITSSHRGETKSHMAPAFLIMSAILNGREMSR